MSLAAIDWNQVWKEQVERSNRCHEEAKALDYWAGEETARQYWLSRYEDGGRRIAQLIEDLAVIPRSRVLDIGAGPGVLALPLAQRTARVTAVEPSAGMMSVLRAMIAEQGLTNLTCLQKFWDDVEPGADLDPPYDVVLASMSLTMPDLRAAIEKMEAVASGRIHLIWFADRPDWEEQARLLWPRLHRAEYQPPPGSDVLFNVLYQMGIYPNVKVFRSHFGERFPSLDGAVDFFRARYGLTTGEQQAILRDYLGGVITQTDGLAVLPYSAVYMHLWWQKSRPKRLAEPEPRPSGRAGAKGN